MLIRVVIDGECALVSEPLDFHPQDSCAARVKRQHPHLIGAAAGERMDALTHFTRRLVGKRQRQHLPWSGALFGKQIGDAVREHARFAAARTGNDQKRALRCTNGLALFRV